MNIINTSYIIDPAQQQPFTGPSLEFIQASTVEMLGAIIQSMIGNSIGVNVPYALYGCVQSGSNSYTFSPGYIYYNGEIFKFPFDTTGSPLGPIMITTGNPLCTITTFNNYIDPVTGSPVDPLIFSNLFSQPVHDQRLIVLTNGVPVGSNTATQFNFNSIVYLVPPPTIKLYQPIFYTPAGSAGATVALGNPITTPNDGVTRTYKMSCQVPVQIDSTANRAAARLFVKQTSGTTGTFTPGIGGQPTYLALYNCVQFTNPDHQYIEDSMIVEAIATLGPGCTIQAYGTDIVSLNGNTYFAASQYGNTSGLITLFEL